MKTPRPESLIYIPAKRDDEYLRHFYMGVPYVGMQPNQAFQNDSKLWHNWKALGKYAHR